MLSGLAFSAVCNMNRPMRKGWRLKGLFQFAFLPHNAKPAKFMVLWSRFWFISVPNFFHLLYCQTCFKITSFFFFIAEPLTPQALLAPSKPTFHGKVQVCRGHSLLLLYSLETASLNFKPTLCPQEKSEHKHHLLCSLLTVLTWTI